MKLDGFYKSDLELREIKPNTSLQDIQNATKKNGMDEIVVENDKGKFILFADELNIKGKWGLPSVGENIKFGDFEGKVILSDDEFKIARPVANNALDNLKNIYVKNETDVQQEKEIAAKQAVIELNRNITQAEKASASNTNSVSIYGPEVSVEEAQEWLDNNPFLAMSEKLAKLADFNNDKKITAQELSRIATNGAVVLNGPNSFYLPGERAQAQPVNNSNTKPQMSEQEKYYKRKNAEANAELAVDVAVGVGSALFDTVNTILR